MTGSLVVPLDGSKLAESALPWANALAKGLEAAIDLVTVITHEPTVEDPGPEIGFGRRLGELGAAEAIGLIEDAETADVRYTQTGLEQLVAARTWNGPVQVTVLRGEPSDEIADHADRTGARLIVMATHAREGPARAILGSVAGEVINHTRVPVWAIHPGLSTPDELPRKVLVPLDGSALSDAVLPIVTDLAGPLGWSVVLFTADEGRLLPVPHHAPHANAQHLVATAETLRECGVPTETLTAPGHRVAAIVEAVHDTGCGLIAMSTHGRRGLDRWLRGSVADAVVHQADVPVLVVRPATAPPRTIG